MRILWSQLEDKLFTLTSQEIKNFAENLEEPEVFYGFGFLCNAACGEVLLCLNTPEALSELLDISGAGPAAEDELRWALTDWKYSDFASRKFRLEWTKFQEAIEDNGLAAEDDEEPAKIAQRFLECVCRVLLRLEAASAFDVLQQSPDWDVFVADNDEDEEDSWERLERLREEFEVGI